MRAGRGSVPLANILIVDDDPVSLMRCVELLEAQGHCALGVESAREALELLRSDIIDLLIVDIMMPKMDGLDLARAVRDVAAWRDVPIVLVSALHHRETRVRAREIADEFLLKPMDSLELSLRVGSMLKQRARMLALREEVQRLQREGDLQRRDNARLQEENLRLREAMACTERASLDGIRRSGQFGLDSASRHSSAPAAPARTHTSKP